MFIIEEVKLKSGVVSEEIKQKFRAKNASATEQDTTYGERLEKFGWKLVFNETGEEIGWLPPDYMADLIEDYQDPPRTFFFLFEASLLTSALFEACNK